MCGNNYLMQYQGLILITDFKEVRVLCLSITFLNIRYTASCRNLAQLGHKNLIFACFKCSFVDFFLLKYELTQAQVINLLESFLRGDNIIST